LIDSKNVVLDWPRLLLRRAVTIVRSHWIGCYCIVRYIYDATLIRTAKKKNLNRKSKEGAP